MIDNIEPSDSFELVVKLAIRAMARLRDGLLASLSGLLCVYKPADLSVDAIKKTIIKQLCAQGNAALGWPKLPDIKVRGGNMRQFWTPS